MRIVALTFGTEGDSRPMIALCRGLRDSGHDVTLLAERTAHAYAESLGVPFVALAGDMAAELQAESDTLQFGSSFLPPWPLPAWAHRASHRLVLAVLWRAFRGAVNDARRDVTQQPPRRAQWDGYPVVCGISPTLVPQPRDWPERYAIAGYWWPPREPEFAPDASLAEFLAAGAHAHGKSRQRWPTRTASPMRSNASSAGPVLERVAALR